MKNTIVLLGMSGVGKSYHARRLGQEGYRVFHIDDQIASSLGKRNLRDIALWLGQPYEEKYLENSQMYLSLEKRFTKEALIYAKNHEDERIVIDTTGSVIYLPKETLGLLADAPHTIFLDTGEEVVSRMIETYLREPKPVIWGEMAKSFSRDNYLEEVETLYPELLKKRRELYRTHSKKVIHFDKHKSREWSPGSLLS